MAAKHNVAVGLICAFAYGYNASAAGILDMKGGLAEAVRGANARVIAVAEERSNDSRPLPNTPTTTPLIGSNGTPQNSTKNTAPASTSESLKKILEKQTPEERQTIVRDIARQITELQTQLGQRLAIVPRTSDTQIEIKALNEALSAKRQAYEFARGSTATISLAAAESFSNTTSPYFLICRDVLWAPNDSIRWIDKINPAKERIVATGRSVGLITVNGRPAGTGFVVGSNHVITNLHVLRLIADYDAVKNFWSFRGMAKITFDVEYDLGKEQNCEKGYESRSYYVNGVFAIPDAQPNGKSDDLAILLTSSDKDFPPSLTLAERPLTKYSGNMTVAVIGYPGPPSDMTIVEQIQFFKTPRSATPQFPFKRLSQGFTGEEAVTENGYFVHKANTSGGNSGSPIVDLDDGALVGIHVEGFERFSDVLGYNRALTSSRVKALLLKVGLYKP